MKTILYRDLSDACRWNEIEEVSQILQTNNDIDLTYSEYKLFNFAIQNNSCKLLSILIKYYENNQLSALNIENKSYHLQKAHLRDKLENFVEGINLSQEMKNVLSPYIDFEGSENNDSFIDDDQTHNDLHSTFDNSKGNLLTEENLKRFSNNSSDEKLKFTEELLGHNAAYDTQEHPFDLAGNLHNADES